MGGQPAVDPPLVLPLVLQVFPIPGSSDPEEFHGGPPSRPDPVGIDVALSARLAISKPFWGAWPPLQPMPAVCPFFPGIVHGERPLQLCGGFFRTAPPPQLWLLPSWPRRPSGASWGAPVCPSFSVGAWGASCSSLGFTLVWVRWWDLSLGPWGVSPCGYIGGPEPGVCGIVASPFFATGGPPFLFWI
jgi:hypothetical protein